jgi:GT2 family glycosyltransferase
VQLSIVIVNYNSGDYLKNCLESISKNNGFKDKINITVYDNGSTDNSLVFARKFFPEVQYMGNHTNLGFAQAVNNVIKSTKSEYILILNPDVVIFPMTINLMLKFMTENHNCGVLGGEILNPSGFQQPTCRRFPNYFNVSFGRRSLARRIFPENFFSHQYLCLDLDYEKPQKVDFVEGSLMMIRRKALEQVGLFDEDFFLYLEDADICYRINKSGWDTWWLPEAYAIHYRGENFRKDNIHPAMHHSKGFYTFFLKHYKPPTAVRILLKLLMTIRLIYVISTESIKEVFCDINFSPRN